jgi:Na+-transporting methylmalonyl-CoA/oxaloacetate decarboxylase gamma subunit
MTSFQKTIVSLMTILVLVVSGVGAFLVYNQVKPTREEQLAAACQRNPVECEKMRTIHATTDAAIAQAEQYGPGMASSIANLRRVQDEYDDRFIRGGCYGEGPCATPGSSVTLQVPPDLNASASE